MQVNKLKATVIVAIYKDIEALELRHYLGLMRDLARHYEEGIKFNNFLYRVRYKDKTSHILGCNFAVNRDDMISINGFNENYKSPSAGEDTDIEFRLIKNGCIIKPIRNMANIFHLYHEQKYSASDRQKSIDIFKKVEDNCEIIFKNRVKKVD